MMSTRVTDTSHASGAGTPRSAPMMRTLRSRTRNVLTAGALLIAAAMVGCTPEPSEQTPSSPAPTTTESRPLLKDQPEESTLDPGRYVVEPHDAPFAPLVPVLSVPKGYVRIDAGIIAQDQDLNFLWVWNIQSVYTHPCDAVPMPVGPSVADLANALAAQPLRNGTDPVPVRVGGYDGLYVELSSPKDIDLDKCFMQAFNSWPGRGQRELGTMDLLWIVDVKGQRFTFDLSHAPTASPEQVNELKTMVTTATFIPRRGN